MSLERSGELARATRCRGGGGGIILGDEVESRLRGGGGGEMLKDDMGSSIGKVRKIVGRRGG